MQTLITKFTLAGGQLLDSEAQNMLRDMAGFQRLTQKRGQQAWGGPIPGTTVFMAEIQGAAVFMTREWEVTIYSSRLIDCVGAMCTILNSLRQLFNAPVEVELLDTPGGSKGTVENQLRKERIIRRSVTIGIWVSTSILTGFIGAMIQKFFFS